MPELAVQMLGQQQGRQGIDAHVLQEEVGIYPPDALLGTHRPRVQDTRSIDQPVDLIQLCRPFFNRCFIGEIQPMPADLRVVLRGRAAIAGCDDFPDLGSSDKCFDKSTANATGPARDYDVHQMLPAKRGTGQSVFQHFLTLRSSACLQMGALSHCQTFY